MAMRNMTCVMAVGVLMVGGMMLLSGCIRAEARLPERINIGGAEYGQGPIEPVPPADTSDPAALARENQQLRRQNAELISRLNAAEARLKDTRRHLDEKDERIDELEEQIDDLQDRVEDLQDDLEKARQRR